MASFRVDNLTDTTDGDTSAGNLSLREALNLANANPDADAITFAPGLAGGTLTLTQGQLGIFAAVAIDGDLNGDGRPDITVDANGQSRVLLLRGSGTTDVDLEGLVVTGGRTTGQGEDGGGKGAGTQDGNEQDGRSAGDRAGEGQACH